MAELTQSEFWLLKNRQSLEDFKMLLDLLERDEEIVLVDDPEPEEEPEPAEAEEPEVGSEEWVEGAEAGLVESNVAWSEINRRDGSSPVVDPGAESEADASESAVVDPGAAPDEGAPA